MNNTITKNDITPIVEQEAERILSFWDGDDKPRVNIDSAVRDVQDYIDKCLGRRSPAIDIRSVAKESITKQLQLRFGR